jgi:hypothetical protein
MQDDLVGQGNMDKQMQYNYDDDNDVMLMLLLGDELDISILFNCTI